VKRLHGICVHFFGAIFAIAKTVGRPSMRAGFRDHSVDRDPSEISGRFTLQSPPARCVGKATRPRAWPMPGIALPRRLPDETILGNPRNHRETKGG